MNIYKSTTNREETKLPLLVLAGGFGSRLRDLVHKVPKSLAPINNIPFLSYLLDDWVKSGVRDFIFLLHYKSELIEAFLDNYFLSVSSEILNYNCIKEPIPLGTGGAITFALSKVNLPNEILISNSDTWLPGGIGMLINAQANSVASVRVYNPQRYGLFNVKGKRVVGFKEKGNCTSEGFINAGAYRLETKFFSRESIGSAFAIEDKILSELASKQALHLVECNKTFIDIGIPEDYLRFDRWIKEGRKYEL